MPSVPTATSGSLWSASDGVELSATKPQISCARRSERPSPLMNVYAANRFCEQPRTHCVIEQIRLGEPLRILKHRSDKRIVCHADACNQSCPSHVVIHGRLRGRLRALFVANPFDIHRSPLACVLLS